MLLPPLRKSLKSQSGAITEPSIASSALQRNLVHSIMDTFVPVSKDWNVRADLIVAGPERAAAWGGDETRLGVKSAGSYVPNLGPLAPTPRGTEDRDALRTPPRRPH